MIYKGKKLIEGSALSIRPCTLLVIENAAVDEVDPHERDACPQWMSRWIPLSVRSVGGSVLSTVASAVTFVVGTHDSAADDDHAYPAVTGEDVQLEVTFVADSATHNEIVVAWSAGLCGDLLEESHCRFENYAPGDRLTATQTVRSNGWGGEVVCTITDVTNLAPRSPTWSMSLGYPRQPATYLCPHPPCVTVKCWTAVLLCPCLHPTEHLQRARPRLQHRLQDTSTATRRFVFSPPSV